MIYVLDPKILAERWIGNGGMFSGDRIERRGAGIVVYCSVRGWHLTRLAARLRTVIRAA
jgi:hypothetical protein